MAHPVKLKWTVDSMKSAQEEVKKTSTLEAWPTLNNKTSMIIFNIQNLLKLIAEICDQLSHCHIVYLLVQNHV